jgi:glycosyltransferase involved in cell wall biosynthesis
MTSKPKRLAVLLTHPVQYFKPIFNRLAIDQDIELLVFFGCNHGVIPSHDPDFGIEFAWDNNPTDGFNHCFIKQMPLVNLSKLGVGLETAWQAYKQIKAWQPDAVLIFAYSPLFITACTLLLAANGNRLLLRADGTDRAFKRPVWKSWLKDMLLRFYYRLFSKIYPIGSDSNDHFARLGVKAKMRKQVNFAVDYDYFDKQVKYWQPKCIQSKQDLGIPDHAEVLLWVGKITPIKAPLLLIDALAHLPKDRLDKLWLVVVGDGPLRNQMTTRINQVIPSQYYFAGFQNQSQLGRFYTIADSLIFPSIEGETWGLVVNEALQFGLRVIASDHPGSVRDLIQKDPHQIFKSGNIKDLALALNKPWKKLNPSYENHKHLPKPEHLAIAILSTI